MRCFCTLTPHAGTELDLAGRLLEHSAAQCDAFAKMPMAAERDNGHYPNDHIHTPHPLLFLACLHRHGPPVARCPLSG